jgi:hypothetical protein
LMTCARSRSRAARSGPGPFPARAVSASPAGWHPARKTAPMTTGRSSAAVSTATGPLVTVPLPAGRPDRVNTAGRFSGPGRFPVHRSAAVPAVRAVLVPVVAAACPVLRARVRSGRGRRRRSGGTGRATVQVRRVLLPCRSIPVRCRPGLVAPARCRPLSVAFLAGRPVRFRPVSVAFLAGRPVRFRPAGCRVRFRPVRWVDARGTVPDRKDSCRRGRFRPVSGAVRLVRVAVRPVSAAVRFLGSRCPGRSSPGSAAVRCLVGRLRPVRFPPARCRDRCPVRCRPAGCRGGPARRGRCQAGRSRPASAVSAARWPRTRFHPVSFLPDRFPVRRPRDGACPVRRSPRPVVAGCRLSRGWPRASRVASPAIRVGRAVLPVSPAVPVSRVRIRRHRRWCRAPETLRRSPARVPRRIREVSLPEIRAARFRVTRVGQFPAYARSRPESARRPRPVRPVTGSVPMPRASTRSSPGRSRPPCTRPDRFRRPLPGRTPCRPASTSPIRFRRASTRPARSPAPARPAGAVAAPARASPANGPAVAVAGVPAPRRPVHPASMVLPARARFRARRRPRPAVPMAADRVGRRARPPAAPTVVGPWPADRRAHTLRMPSPTVLTVVVDRVRSPVVRRRTPHPRTPRRMGSPAGRVGCVAVRRVRSPGRMPSLRIGSARRNVRPGTPPPRTRAPDATGRRAVPVQVSVVPRLAAVPRERRVRSSLVPAVRGLRVQVSVVRAAQEQAGVAPRVRVVLVPVSVVLVAPAGCRVGRATALVARLAGRRVLSSRVPPVRPECPGRAGSAPATGGRFVVPPWFRRSCRGGRASVPRPYPGVPARWRRAPPEPFSVPASAAATASCNPTRTASPRTGVRSTRARPARPPLRAA